MQRKPIASATETGANHQAESGFDPKGYVWRISAHTPQGEWVRRNAPSHAGSNRDSEGFGDANWVASSFDLLSGVTVVEASGAAGSALLDRFFAAPDKRSHG